MQVLKTRILQTKLPELKQQVALTIQLKSKTKCTPIDHNQELKAILTSEITQIPSTNYLHGNSLTRSSALTVRVDSNPSYFDSDSEDDPDPTWGRESSWPEGRGLPPLMNQPRAKNAIPATMAVPQA